MTLWGCQAGKDVYVEKPCSHNIHEGRIAVEAARKYNRIVQHGTQNRSRQDFADVVAAIKSGKLGRLLVSRGLCYKSTLRGGLGTRGSIGYAKPTDPPAALDFNLWLGPAAEQAYHSNLVPYRWHWFWDFGNGDIGNQGVHEMDKARWVIPGATLPRSVFSLGGRLGYRDQGQTPSSQIAVFDYSETQLIFEVRGLPSKGYLGEQVGNICHLEARHDCRHEILSEGKRQAGAAAADRGSGAARAGSRRSFRQFHRGRAQPPDRRSQCAHPRGPLLGGPLPSRQYVVPAGPGGAVQSAHQGIWRQQGRLRKPCALEDYLKENHVNLEETKYQLGRKLTLDAHSETIVGDPEATKLLSRSYRKPFVVPEKLG